MTNAEDILEITVRSPAFVKQWHAHSTIDAVSESSPQIRFIVDGTQVQNATLTKTNAWGEVQTEFTIGALTGGSSGFFTGLIDDVRILHGVLGSTQIAYAKSSAYPSFYVLSTVEYTYDHQNRMLSRTHEQNAPFGSPFETSEFYIHDGGGQSLTSARLGSGSDCRNGPEGAVHNRCLTPLDEVGQIVLRLDADGNVMNRYLWGPGVDQLVADEQVTDVDEPGDVFWTLTDHLGTVRDLIRYNETTQTVEQAVHRTYDSFGNVNSEINLDAVDLLFGYTSRPFDPATGLQNNLNRWYDATAGRWTGEDPIGFEARDPNLVRFVLNRVVTLFDPSGLKDTKHWTWKEVTDEDSYNPVTIIVEVPVGGFEATITAVFNYPQNSETASNINTGSYYDAYNNDDDTSKPGIHPKKGTAGQHDQLPTLKWTVPLQDGKNRIRIRPRGRPNGTDTNDRGLQVDIETDKYGNVKCMEAKVLNDPGHVLK